MDGRPCNSAPLMAGISLNAPPILKFQWFKEGKKSK